MTMNAKMNKISAIERLRIKKTRLKAEEQGHLYELDKHFTYLHQNFGSLLLDAGWTAVKAQFPPFVQELLPGGDRPKAIGTSQKPISTFAKKHPRISAVTNQVVDLVPLIYSGLKPILVSLALKKAKKIIFR